MASSTAEVAGLLARVPVFETLSPDDLDRVAEVTVTAQVALRPVDSEAVMIARPGAWAVT